MNNDVLRYNIVKFVCFFIISCLWQQVAGNLAIWGIVPNLTFVLLVASSIAEEKFDFFYPVIFGLIYDYLNGAIFGVYTLVFVLTTFFSNELYHKNFKNVTFMEIVFVILSCMFVSLFSALFISLMEGGFWTLLIRISLVEFIYNSVIGIVVLLLYKKILSPSNRRFRRNRKHSAWRV